jgi:hypothetical protein
MSAFTSTRADRATQALCRFNRHPDVAAALAYSRDRSRSVDRRPELLLWAYGGCDEFQELAFDFTFRHVAIYAERRSIAATAATLGVATNASLALVRRPSTSSKSRDGRHASAAELAAACGIRKSSFLAIRGAGIYYLESALNTGMSLFLRACASREPRAPAPMQTVSAVEKASWIRLHDPANPLGAGTANAMHKPNRSLPTSRSSSTSVTMCTCTWDRNVG